MVLDDKNPQRHVEESSLPCHRRGSAGKALICASGITVNPPAKKRPPRGYG